MKRHILLTCSVLLGCQVGDQTAHPLGASSTAPRDFSASVSLRFPDPSRAATEGFVAFWPDYDAAWTPSAKGVSWGGCEGHDCTGYLEPGTWDLTADAPRLLLGLGQPTAEESYNACVASATSTSCLDPSKFSQQWPASWPPMTEVTSTAWPFGDGGCFVTEDHVLGCGVDPVTHPIDAPVVQISGSKNEGVCALDTSGKITCWRDSETASSAYPLMPPISRDQWVEVAVAGYDVCAVASTGEVFCHRGTVNDEVQLTGGTLPWHDVKTDSLRVCAIDAEGMLRCMIIMPGGAMPSTISDTDPHNPYPSRPFPQHGGNGYTAYAFSKTRMCALWDASELICRDGNHTDGGEDPGSWLDRAPTEGW